MAAPIRCRSLLKGTLLYGNEAAATGSGTLAMTGAIGTGSMVLAIVATLMIVGGLTALVIRRRKLKGMRP